MLEVLGASPEFRNVSSTGGFLPDRADRAATKFERRGARLGHAVRDLEFERVPR